MRNTKFLLFFLLVSFIGGGFLVYTGIEIPLKVRCGMFISALLIFIINRILRKKLKNMNHFSIRFTCILVWGYVAYAIAASFAGILRWGLG